MSVIRLSYPDIAGVTGGCAAWYAPPALGVRGFPGGDHRNVFTSPGNLLPAFREKKQLLISPKFFCLYFLFMRRSFCASTPRRLARHRCSNRAEHLLIHRIQSHTNPKRRKVFLKQAGQKSSKEELPKQRKGPKRTGKCRLKVQTHIWENTPGPPHNFISGCSAAGSAPALGAGCRRFESCHSDHLS